jgi:hypothetical protein
VASPPRSPIRPLPAPPDAPKLTYRRGRRYPRAIAWFGARSFWGHLWHLAASVIATEDIDSRAWMRAHPPEELTRRVAEVLGGRAGAGSLAEALERDVWIDFVSDTGDDVSVSKAVARLLFATYEVTDPADEARTLTLPRGDILLFGGDTAYPVATELEIHNRVIVPFGQVLRAVADGQTRVLMGIPGNHDWYAGLDGYGRMFRARQGAVEDEGKQRPDEIVRFAEIGHFIDWVEAFRVGRYVGKRSTLPLQGYVPVQTASYFALSLAPGLDLWGVDRQLRAVDFQQRAYFAEQRTEAAGRRGLMLCLADPVRAFLEPSPAGVDILEALDVSLENDGPLVLAGDTHHYCREQVGRGTHVTAGGGGAFLHPARIPRRGMTPPAAEFPGPRASLALALQIPLQIVHGRSGFLVHLAVALLYAPGWLLVGAVDLPPIAVALGTAALAGFLCRMLAGFRNRTPLMYLLSALAGLLLGVVPFAVDEISQRLPPTLSMLTATFAWGLGALVSVYFGTLVVGSYLTALTILGLEQHQAFSALGHPGYKHFVRLRVRRDGSAVDAWVLGQVDPLKRNEPVVLVDRFTWSNPAASEGVPQASRAARG